MTESISSGGLTPEEKLEAAKDFRNISHDGVNHASRRGSELSDEFNRLEVQIATILFAFATVFFGDYIDADLAKFSPAALLLIKLSFAAGLVFLLLSLVIGLLHIKRKEKFWDEIMHNKVAVFKRWNMAARREVSLEDARSFQLGIAQGEEKVIRSPIWTWVLQTIFLGMGILFLFVLGLILLFR